MATRDHRTRKYRRRERKRDSFPLFCRNRTTINDLLWRWANHRSVYFRATLFPSIRSRMPKGGCKICGLFIFVTTGPHILRPSISWLTRTQPPFCTGADRSQQYESLTRSNQFEFNSICKSVNASRIKHMNFAKLFTKVIQTPQLGPLFTGIWT